MNRRTNNADRKWKQRERARTWLMKYGFNVAGGEAFLTRVMEIKDEKFIERLRRMVETKGN
jgi:hypothetical protein